MSSSAQKLCNRSMMKSYSYKVPVFLLLLILSVVITNAQFFGLDEAAKVISKKGDDHVKPGERAKELPEPFKAGSSFAQQSAPGAAMVKNFIPGTTTSFPKCSANGRPRNQDGTSTTAAPTTAASETSIIPPQCALPVEELGNGNLAVGTSPRPSSSTSDFLPSWINIELAKTGQKFYNAHFGAIFISYLMTSLLFVFIPQGAEVTLFSGNSDTAQKFAKRYTATASQFALWSRDLFGEGSNTENIRRSITTVRSKHLAAAARAIEAQKSLGAKFGLENRYANYEFKYTKFWDAVSKDLESSNIPEQFRSWPKSYNSTYEKAVPINQFVLGMAQWTLAGLVGGFTSATLIHDATDEQLIGFNHFYAVIGYCLGIDDAYNVCLKDSLEKQTQFYKDVLNHYIFPAIFERNFYSKILIEIIADAMLENALPVAYTAKSLDSATPVTVTMEALTIRLFKDYLKIPATNLESTSSAETKSFTQYYENVFVPQAKMPYFHPGLTAAANAALQAAGRKEFNGAYSTDEQISSKVWV